MFSKAIVLLALIAGVFGGAVPAYQSTYAAQPFAAATYVHDSPHVGHQSESTVRGGFGSSVSHQQKAIDSAFSSVRKTDTRITNPALTVHQHTYAAAPVAHQVAYAQPQVAYAQPQVQYAQPQVAYAQQAYAPAPVAAYKSHVYSGAPAQVVQPAVAAPAVYKAAAPVAYAAPVAAAPVAKVVSPSLLGVQYSAVSPAVATLNFNGYGISYGY